MCSSCEKNSKNSDSFQFPVQDTSDMEVNELQIKIKALEEEIKSLHEIIKVKDEDIRQLQAQVQVGDDKQSADRNLSVSCENTTWKTVQKQRGQWMSKRYSGTEASQNVPVPIANKFLPLETPMDEEGSTQQNHSNQNRKPKKKTRVLFLADSNGRFCSEKIREGLGGDYDVCTIFKPGAKINQVIESVEQLTKYFTQDDVVVLHAGSNDLPLNDSETARNISND